MNKVLNCALLCTLMMLLINCEEGQLCDNPEDCLTIDTVFVETVDTILIENDPDLVELPDSLILGPQSYEIFRDTLVLKSVPLDEGLTGWWKVTQNSKLYSISNSDSSSCVFVGELLGKYMVSYTISNGAEKKTQFVSIEIAGFTDYRDGQTYRAVQIGDQVWMAENLRAELYTDGEQIPYGEQKDIWISSNSPMFCWYNNDSSYAENGFGGLYNWHVIETGRISPSGWHVPSDDEWYELEQYIDQSIQSSTEVGWRGIKAGTELKSSNGWDLKGNGNDTYEFGALPSGYRSYKDGNFKSLERGANFWTSTPFDENRGLYRSLSYNLTGIYRYDDNFDHNNKNGFSIRCIKN